MISEIPPSPNWIAGRSIVLTGASGLLGTYFCHYLKDFKKLVPVVNQCRALGFPLQSL